MLGAMWLNRTGSDPFMIKTLKITKKERKVKEVMTTMNFSIVVVNCIVTVAGSFPIVTSNKDNHRQI